MLPTRSATVGIPPADSQPDPLFLELIPTIDMSPPTQRAMHCVAMLAAKLSGLTGRQRFDALRQGDFKASIACSVTGVLAAVALSGCASLIKPNLEPDPTVAKAYDNAPTLQNAIAVGTSMRERYSAKVENQIAWERGIGVGLIGAATIGADLAMRSVGKSEILGLGLAGAALYTGSNWLFSKPQQLIYAAGAGAVQCALDTVQPLQEPYKQQADLQSKVDQIVVMVAEVRSLEAIVPISDPNRPPTSVVRADAMIAHANTVLTAARQALGVLNGAPGALRSSLSAIQIQVTNAYITNSPNMQALVDSLKSLMPAVTPRISTGSMPVIPPPTLLTAAKHEDELDRKTTELQNLIADVSRIIAAVNTSPAPGTLKQCDVDLKQAGLSMKLTTSDLSIAPGSAATVVVSGGVLPYRTEWIGTRPASNHVDRQIESGLGSITVTATAAAEAGTYQLLILDAGQGREILNVTILGKTGTPSQKQRAAAPAVDVQVKQLQQDLIGRGFSHVKINGKEATLIADGRMGAITTEAMRQFYKQQGEDVQDNAIPSDGKLFTEVAQMIEDLKKSEAGAR